MRNNRRQKLTEIAAAAQRRAINVDGATGNGKTTYPIASENSFQSKPSLDLAMSETEDESM